MKCAANRSFCMITLYAKRTQMRFSLTMTSNRKKAKKDVTPAEEEQTASRTRSGRKRADSASSARKNQAPTTPQGDRISSPARHTRSATKQQDEKQEEEEDGGGVSR